MSNHTKRVVPALLILGLAIITCNMPSGTKDPVLSNEEIVNTVSAKALTAQAAAAPSSASPAAPASAAPGAGQCVPMVTANTNANVRSGPSTDYGVVGNLPTGATAPLAGRNDTGAWWYIQFAGGYGGYAWVAGSVTTASCIPPALQVVAAPPLPTPVPVTNAPPAPAAAGKPDLYVSEYSWSPDPPHMGVSFHVRVGAYNKGEGPAGAFKVEWWLTTTGAGPTCTWNVASLVAHGGLILECNYTPGGWANYPSQVIVDSGDSVNESHEGNNTKNATLPIKP